MKMNIVATLAFVLLAGLSSCGPAPAAPTATLPVPTATAIALPIPIQPLDAERKLTVGSLERTYLLHIPKGLNDQQLVPLVLVFHGYQENATYARTYTGLDEIADKQGFIAIYANGSGDPGSLSWNASVCCGYALTNDVDEPGFVRAIIADVGSLAKVDPKRIYAAGFSNGALLSYRLACQMSDTFAAVAPVAGVLTYQPCEPQQPVSLMDVYGVKDQIVPFDGGGTGIQFPSVGDSVATWRRLDGCQGDGQVEHNGIVTHTAYGGCKRGVAVELYAVDGVGHSWPSKYILPLSQIVWDFFAAHPKP